MLKAKRISAVVLSLPGGVEATMVQEGDEWNSMREYHCIAPHEFVGQIVITAPDGGGMGFSRVFDSVFGRLHEEAVILASPKIGELLKKASQPST